MSGGERCPPFCFTAFISSGRAIVSGLAALGEDGMRGDPTGDLVVFTGDTRADSSSMKKKKNVNTDFTTMSN